MHAWTNTGVLISVGVFPLGTSQAKHYQDELDEETLVRGEGGEHTGRPPCSPPACPLHSVHY